jgi:lipopolysaccharide export system permease protein
MRLLDRYLLRELLVPLAYCLSGFLMFWIAFDLFAELGDLHEHKMHAGDIVQYYLVKTPEFFVLVLPMALLLALLYTLTNHARHHEITAIRAAGVSLWRMCLPYLLVGFLASIVLFSLNELWVPNSVDLAEAIKTRRVPPTVGALPPHQVRDLGFSNARDGRRWHIEIYDSNRSEMFKPFVIWTLADGSTRWLAADRAIRTNEVWTFFNVREYRAMSPTNSMLVPTLQTNVLAIPEFSETPDQIKSEIKLASRVSLRAAKKADVPISEILNYLRLHPHPSRADRLWLYTKMHGRLAAPWTCLVVVLIALPFGAASGRRNIFVGVASSIFICFTYFVLQQFGLALGTGGYVPSWLAAWFPNLAFGSAGLWLTASVR